MFCEHNFVEKGNNIYCTKCGKNKLLQCDHKWEVYEKIEKVQTRTEEVKGILVILKCSKCGDFKNHKAGLKDFY